MFVCSSTFNAELALTWGFLEYFLGEKIFYVQVGFVYFKDPISL